MPRKSRQPWAWRDRHGEPQTVRDGNVAKHEVLGTTEQKPPAKTTPKPLTRAQKYAKALKACKKIKNKHKRAQCVTQAKKKYGPTAKKAKRASHRARKARRR